MVLGRGVWLEFAKLHQALPYSTYVLHQYFFLFNYPTAIQLSFTSMLALLLYLKILFVLLAISTISCSKFSFLGRVSLIQWREEDIHIYVCARAGYCTTCVIACVSFRTQYVICAKRRAALARLQCRAEQKGRYICNMERVTCPYPTWEMPFWLIWVLSDYIMHGMVLLG